MAILHALVYILGCDDIDNFTANLTKKILVFTIRQHQFVRLLNFERASSGLWHCHILLTSLWLLRTKRDGSEKISWLVDA